MTCVRFFLFIVITFALLGDESHPAHFSSSDNSRDPSLIISGVHIFSGAYAEVINDMRSPFAVPTSSERTFNTPRPDSLEYFGGNLMGGWNWNWENSISFSTNHKEHHHRHLLTTYNGPHNSKLEFDVRKHKRDKADPRLFAQARRGETNRASWYVSGRQNTHNLSLLYNKDRTQGVLRNGAGDEKIFCYSKRHGSSHRYNIDREELSSGLSLKYEHTESLMKRMNVRGRDGQELSHIFIRHAEDSKHFDKHPFRDIHDSTGRMVRYIFCRHNFKYPNNAEHEKRYALERVVRPSLPDIHYTYVLHDEYLRGRLSRISYPEGRFSAFEYYNRGKEVMPESGKTAKIDKNDYRVGRVKRILAPVGANGETGPVATFRYDGVGKYEFWRKGITSVFDARGRKTGYEHQDFRLKTIHLWGPHNGSVAMRERFIWSEKEGQEGDLLVRYVENESGQILLAREYFYDDNHNVIEEKLWGNISGNSTGPREITAEGVVHSTGDCQHSLFRYSEDGYNLLLWEKRGLLEVDYSYHPHSSLLAKKIERDPSGLFRATTYEYDNTAHVCREILEDESGYRVEKRMRNNHLGLCEEVEILGLKKELYSYNAKGLLVEKRILDTGGELLSSSLFEYDSKENCIYERNPLGQEIFRTFDSNKNLLTEKGPDPRIERHFRYDLMNRLIEVKEIHPEGVRATYFSYNVLSQKVHETDFRGHQKEFHYDWWESPAATLFPSVISDAGMDRYAAHEEHNSLGHLISKTAPDGCKTHIEPTILGSPISIKHPDGSEERFGYTLFGQTLFHVEKGGLRHEYCYDAFGRIVSETLIDEKGCFLSKVIKRYSGLHLIEEIDSYGISTTYSYDPYGRLSEKIRGELYEQTRYDALGRKISFKTPLATKQFAYDVMNRLIEERAFTPEGKLQERTTYGYDEMGNQSSIVSYLQEDKPLITDITYDSFGRVTHKKQGSQQIHVQYIDDYLNEFGQRVEKRIVAAADGVVTELEKDPLGRDVLFIKRGLFGEMLQKKRSHYDSLARLIKTEETVYFQGVEEKILSNCFTYNSDGDLIESREGMGTPECKKFVHEYFRGRKIKTIKPDGTQIYFTYDAMGKMRRLTSGDKSIDYEYVYDGLTRLTEVIDHVAGTILKRCYDQEEHLLQEEFSGYAIDYSYDPFGRLSQVSLLGGSWEYRYEGTALSKIVRHRSQGDYEIGFTKYDLVGELKELTLLGNGGTVAYSHDDEGVFTGFTHPLISDTIVSFDAAKRPTQHLRHIQSESTLSSIHYDPLGQVTEEGGRKYLFDSIFNVREQEGKCYSYNSINQRTDLRYDLNGNLLAYGDMSFFYDALDRLIAVEKGGARTEYAYDGLHRRIRAGNKQFIYQGECEIGSITGGIVNELRLIHSARFGEVGSTAAIEIGDQAYSSINDSFGHIVGLIDQSGNLIDNLPFSPFGKGIEKTGLHPWRFSSKRIDPETGLVFFGQRFYSIELMRWLTPDPLSLKDGSNLYAYVHNNPIQHIDAFGLFAEKGGWLDGMLRSIFSFPGRSLEFCGRQCFPVPLVREAIEFTGWILQGKRHSDWIPSYSRNHTDKGCKINGEATGNKAIYFVNGMNYTKKEFMAEVERISSENPDVPVYFTYNGHKGVVTDLIECVLNRLGISTRPVDVMRDHIREIFQEKGDDFKMTLIAHSQGGIITSNVGKQLNPNILEKIDVRTFGSGKIIDDVGWRSAINYVSSHDPVSMISDPLNFFKYGINKNSCLVILKRESDDLFDHKFSGETYRKKMNNVIDEFLTAPR